MGRILVVTSSQSGGDLNIAVAVALGLLARKHNVQILGDAAVARVSRELRIQTTTFPPEHDLSERLAGALRAGDGEGRDIGDSFLRALLAWTDDVTPWAVAAMRAGSPDLVLTILGTAPLVHRAAAEIGIPWVLLNGSFYVGPDSQSLDKDFAPLVVPAIRYCCSIMGDAALVLHGTPDWFNGGVQPPPHHAFVGPLVWEPPGPAPAYLTEPGHPWVLVTLSSLMQGDLELGYLAVEALARHPVRVLATVGPALDRLQLSRIPTNVRVERYVPHSAVLAQSALLVSPGGAGAVMKALYNGVPMVLAPWGFDRRGVARRAERIGAARTARRKDLKDGALSRAVDEVLGNARYREAAAACARRLREQDSIAAACSHIERVLMSGA